jgi:hypothetical protein
LAQAVERRVIHFNRVTSEEDRKTAMLQHKVSASLKRVAAVALGSGHSA